MELKKINIEERVYDVETKKGFSIEYSGEEKKEKANEKRVRDLVKTFVWQLKHDDIAKDVKFLRTMLRDYNESSLTLAYDYGDSERIIASFENYYFVSFKKERKNETGEYESVINISCNAGEILNLGLKENDGGVETELDHEELCEPIKLYFHTAELVAAYKLFYGESPDFMDENINNRMHTMVVVLKQYGIDTLDYYNYDMFGKIIPYSINLANDVSSLFPLARVSRSRGVIDKKTGHKIAAIGKGIRDGIQNVTDKEKAITAIGALIHTSNYCLLDNTAHGEKMFVRAMNEVSEYDIVSWDEAVGYVKMLGGIFEQIKQNK